MSDDNSPFETVETAKEHDERAEQLRHEAESEAAARVEEAFPFDVDSTVSYTGETDSFVVSVVPTDLQDELSDQFDDETFVEVTPLKITIRQGENLLSSVEDWESMEDERGRLKNIKRLIDEIGAHFDDGAPLDEVLDHAEALGLERSKAEHEIEQLRQQGDVWEPRTDYFRTV
jgi:replicative DNA helicase Mcm